MAKTFLSAKTHTRVYLDEVSQDDWLDTEVEREVNNGYQEIVTSVMETYEEFYVTTSQFDSVADQQEYGTSDGLPTDIFKLRRVELNYNVPDSSSIPRRAKPVRVDEILRDLGNSALGISVYRNPAYYLLGSGSGIKLGFVPKPTRAGTNAIKIWYIPYVADLSNDTDNFNIPYPDRYYKLISMYAAAQLLRKGQQEEAVASRYIAEFEQGLAKMKIQLEDRISDDSRTVVDTMGLDVDFTNYSTL